MCVIFRGVTMNIQKTATDIINRQGGIAKTADFIAAGISAAQVISLYNEGLLERVRHGYYGLTNHDSVSEEQLLSKLYPKGVICVESALFHYGYSDFTPRKWSIAVPRTISRTKFHDALLPLQIYYVQQHIYELGRTDISMNGVSLPIYDRERTICDCFKYRARLDRETFGKAINTYAKDPNINLRNLSTYAKELRVYEKVNELMEVLLNG
jgi:putative abortive infection protein abiGI